MLRGRQWARRPAFAIVGSYTLLGASVAGMAVTMYAADDPDASFGLLVASVLAAVLLLGLSTYLYRPLLRRSS